jgi:hypothetical protein
LVLALFGAQNGPVSELYYPIKKSRRRELKALSSTMQSSNSSNSSNSSSNLPALSLVLFLPGPLLQIREFGIFQGGNLVSYFLKNWNKEGLCSCFRGTVWTINARQAVRYSECLTS